MPTFEERYTAWIDGQLSDEELQAFERELESRDLAAAEGDREEAHRLGRLLRRHADAPALSGGEFFNHQLLGRIAADEAPAQPVRAETAAEGFRWPLAHLAWAAAFCLLLTFTIYRSSQEAGGGLQPEPIAAWTEYDEAGAGKALDEPRILEASTDDPSLYVTAMRAENEGLAVVWVDGLEYLPASYQLQ